MAGKQYAGVTADFNTAQAAHNGASAGDTIHLEPSVNNYGAVTCTKTLTWFSIGNFLTPGNQHSSTPGVIADMSLNAGSDASEISVVSAGNIYINAADVIINRSYVSYIAVSGINAVIRQCFVAYYMVLSSTNTLVNNCIIYSGMNMSNTLGTAIITNNVLNYGGRNESVFGPSNIYNSIFQNNISVKGGNFNFSNTPATYNMCPDASFPAGNNNQLNVLMTDVFLNATGTADLNYQLKAGSPAFGAGSGAVDMGAFGGGSPYVLALQPPIPAILFSALGHPKLRN